jgi:hypothetical protein
MAHVLQTRGARRGEREEPKISCCVQTERPPHEGQMRGREDLR